MNRAKPTLYTLLVLLLLVACTRSNPPLMQPEVQAEELPLSANVPEEDPAVPTYVEGDLQAQTRGAPELESFAIHGQSSIVRVYQDSIPWFGQNRDRATLLSLGKVLGTDYFIHPLTSLSAGVPADTDVVIITSNGYGLRSATANQNAQSAQDSLKTFLRSGGVLIVDMGDNDSSGGFVAPGATGTPSHGEFTDDATISLAARGADATLGTADDHPLVLGPDGVGGTKVDLNDMTLDNGGFTTHGSLVTGITLPNDAVTLVTGTFNGIQKPIVSEYCFEEKGRVILDTVTKEHSGHKPVGTGASYFLTNLFAYAMSSAAKCAQDTPELDSTGPIITPNVTGTLGTNGWYTSSVNVAWTVIDDESSIVNRTGCEATEITNDTLGLTLTCEASSSGGTSAQLVTIKRDTTAPTISGSSSPSANANGWNKTDVDVSFTCSDATSEVASCTSSQTLNIEGAGQTIVGTAVDKAGNSASFTVANINIDKTLPQLSPSISPNPVLLNGSAMATPNASDALSGVSSETCDAVLTDSVGSKSVSCTASDDAGNTASASASYGVHYGFSGFSQPVDNTSPNKAKAGQAIPLKWRLTDASGAPVTTLVGVQLSVASLSCSFGSTPDAVEEYASGSSSLQNLGDGYYQYNWKTPTDYASSCKTLRLDQGEGIYRTAAFEFTK